MVKYNHLKRGSDKLEKGCSFTGHRQIKAEHSKRLGALVEKAIEYALSLLADGDILLLAGKGGETYQEIMGIKYLLSDEDIIKACVGGS